MKKLTKCFTKISFLDDAEQLKQILKKLGFKRVSYKIYHKTITVFFGTEINNIGDYERVQERLNNICKTLILWVI